MIEETSPVQRKKRHEHGVGGEGVGHRERSGSNSTIKSLGEYIIIVIDMYSVTNPTKTHPYRSVVT